jgi:hypothetical protein
MMTMGTLISIVTILNITSSAAFVLKGGETNALTATGLLGGHVQQVCPFTIQKYFTYSLNPLHSVQLTIRKYFIFTLNPLYSLLGECSSANELVI